jgi:imidazole glycerol-phosphate synthase subunit HisH
MISIVDYGLGNVEAFLTIFKRLGFEANLAKTESDLSLASKIILPGVGAFDHAIKLLNQSGMRETLETLVLKDKIPILGICVGMQMMASSSDEGVLPGLGLIPGRVRSFHSNKKASKLPLPHMGWNNIHPKSGEPLFENLEKNARFYFLHSYYFECSEPSNVTANVFYGFDFTCSVSEGNIHGVQFHPEKSHHSGSQLLKNFAKI